jgi:Transposase, Mutator family
MRKRYWLVRGVFANGYPRSGAGVAGVMDAELTDAVGTAKGERTPAEIGYRSGHNGRMLVTRVGKLEFRVLQDHDGRTQRNRDYSQAAFSQNESLNCNITRTVGSKIGVLTSHYGGVNVRLLGI